MEKFSLRHYKKSDLDQCLNLFERAFGKTMPKELWQWKYSNTVDNPGIIAEKEGNIIAHYGGMPRKIIIHGKCYQCIQGSDAMTDSKKNITMSKQGVFFWTASEFLKNITGREDGYSLAFGFPSQKVATFYTKMHLSVKVDEIKQVAWLPKSVFLPSIFIKTQKLLQPASLDTVDILWEKMKVSLPNKVIPVKNSEFIRYRYFDHPINRYHILKVSNKFTGNILGIFVIRPHDDGTIELSDIICEKSNLHGVLKSAIRITKKMGGCQLFAWATTTVIDSLPAYNTIVNACSVTASTPQETELADSTRGCWWLMGGDTDFR